MAAKVRTEDLMVDREYEPGFEFYHGIIDKTTEITEGLMSLIHFPPRSESRMHYHENGDMAFYCISGKTTFRIGKQKKQYLIEAGDFIYIPRGEIHKYVNPSETETAVGVIAIFGCSNPYKSGKVIVE